MDKKTKFYIYTIGIIVIFINMLVGIYIIKNSVNIFIYTGGIFVGGLLVSIINEMEKKGLEFNDRIKIVKLFTFKKLEDEIKNK